MSKSAGVIEAAESYEQVEKLVMETPRGRWFLTEFARRQRSKELGLILDSIQRLERAMSWKDAAKETDELAARLTEAAPKPEPLEPRHLKYFKQDEEIFEAAPKPAAPDHERKGAKLVIHRKEPEPQPEPTSVAPAAETQPEPPKRRIVIIRHKAGEEISVPLQNELANAS